MWHEPQAHIWTGDLSAHEYPIQTIGTDVILPHICAMKPRQWRIGGTRWRYMMWHWKKVYPLPETLLMTSNRFTMHRKQFPHWRISVCD
jgi:hypothetical protein